MFYSNYRLVLLISFFLLLGCANNNSDNNRNSTYTNSSSTESNNDDCNSLKLETLDYLKNNWDELKEILQRESSREENEETKNKITIGRIIDLIGGSSIGNKLDKMQKKIESTCPDVYQEYCQEASVFMLSHLDTNN